MNGTPTPPSEFDLPLAGTAVWAGPDGLGDSRFDDVPAPDAVELPPELGDDPALLGGRHAAAVPRRALRVLDALGSDPLASIA